MQNKLVEELMSWIFARPEIQLSKLEAPRTSLPYRTLSQIKQGARPAFSLDHLFGVVYILAGVGLRLGNLSFKQNKNYITVEIEEEVVKQGKGIEIRKFRKKLCKSNEDLLHFFRD